MYKNTYKRLASKIRFNLNQPDGDTDTPYSIAYAQKTPANRKAMFNLIYATKTDKLASRRPGYILWLMAKKENESSTTVTHGGVKPEADARGNPAWITAHHTTQFRFIGKVPHTNILTKTRVA